MRSLTPLSILSILVIVASAMLVMYFAPKQVIQEIKTNCSPLENCVDSTKETIDQHGIPFVYKEKDGSISCYERSECSISTFNPSLFFIDFLIVILTSAALVVGFNVLSTESKKKSRKGAKK